MKFFIILVLALAVCGFATAQVNVGVQDVPDLEDGGLLPVQWDPNDEKLVGVLEFSLQGVIPAAISAGQIPSGNWAWTKVNSVEASSIHEMKYQFNVDISDGAGDIVDLVISVEMSPLGKVKFLNYSVLKK